MLISAIKSRIAVQSSLIILLIFSVLGFLFVFLGRNLIATQESARQIESLNELLSTVERTASIAIFLGDTQLAQEVATGLIQNSTVTEVIIRGQSEELAHESIFGDGHTSSHALPPNAISRKIHSPFNEPGIIGEVQLVPNQDTLTAQVNRSVTFSTLFLLFQMVIVAVSIIIVVVRLITRPITQISHRLHSLRVELGEKLTPPNTGRTDEISSLIKDVNQLVDNLVKLLKTERDLRTEKELEEKKLRAIVDNAETGIFQIENDGTIIDGNPSFQSLFAALPQDIAERKLNLSDMAGDSADIIANLVDECRERRGSHHADIKIAGKGGIRWLNLTLSPIDDLRLQGVANDVTEHKKAEEDAQTFAITDPLTGIANRLGFERKIQWMIETNLRYPEQRFTLMMLDLDWFKQVNDTYGHLAGDRVLVEVARRLQSVVRRADFVCRLGGDEFAIILDSVDEKELQENLARKMIETVNQPIPIDEKSTLVQVGASIGIAVHQREQTITEIVKNADAAMYAAKEAGRNVYRIHDSSLVSSSVQ